MYTLPGRLCSITLSVWIGKSHKVLHPTLSSTDRGGEMDFNVEGPWNTEKYCRPPWLTDKKNFLNSRRFRTAKTVTF